MDKKIPIGERLREERERLGENQTDFAALAGVTRKTLFGYETAERMPPADALAAWAEIGLDVGYVVLGQRSDGATSHHLPPDEELLLDAYRALTATARKALLAELLTGIKRRTSRPKPAESAGVNIRGSGNRAAGRDYHEKE